MSGRLAHDRVRAGTLPELAAATVLVVTLAADADGKPRQALIVRDENGQLRAYRNLCRHIPIPLGFLARGRDRHATSAAQSFLRDGLLTCMTHGAGYRRSDGLCVTGPCRGSSLFPLTLELHGDEIFVLDDAS